MMECCVLQTKGAVEKVSPFNTRTSPHFSELSTHPLGASVGSALGAIVGILVVGLAVGDGVGFVVVGVAVGGDEGVLYVCSVQEKTRKSHSEQSFRLFAK